jgi:alpha-L-arabinofuranosidase
MNRREFAASMGTGAWAAQTPKPHAIAIDPRPLFDFSPYFYMQFMEPLGVTDSSVEASWDYDANDWRKDLVQTTAGLHPDVVRYGGLFSRYYKWREGVGPVERRPPMRNFVWGGLETNRVGTHEFVDFCRRTGAQPLYCVNFLSDGFKRYWNENRAGDAKEAADWVSYANDPDNRERRSHGAAAPYNIKLWQLGNETSYGQGGFSRDEAITRTIEFAKTMRERDRSIELIGWGDRGAKGDFWAGELWKRAGEHLNFVAFHMMGIGRGRPDTVLNGRRYQEAPEAAWQELLECAGIAEKRLVQFEQVMDAAGAKAGIAITEGHLGLRPHNAHPILTEWLSAAYHACTMNLYHRHGARVRMTTGADFAGTRWTVNAVLIQVPRGLSYLTPVASIMRLYKRHNGAQGVAVKAAPQGLDVAASRTGNRVFLHVANLQYRGPVEASFSVEGRTIASGRVFEIAPEDPRLAVGPEQPDVFAPKEKPLVPGSWRFPARSVSAVELNLAV